MDEKNQELLKRLKELEIPEKIDYSKLDFGQKSFPSFKDDLPFIDKKLPDDQLFVKKDFPLNPLSSAPAKPKVMTFRQYCIDFMVNNGMFDNQAMAVMDKIVEDSKNPDDVNHPMMDRWDDPIADYPPVMKGIAIMAVKPAALKWIDENCPMAWFRPMFTPDPEATLAEMQKKD